MVQMLELHAELLDSGLDESRSCNLSRRTILFKSVATPTPRNTISNEQPDPNFPEASARTSTEHGVPW